MTKFIVRGDLPKEPALKIEKQLILSPGVWKKQPISAEAIKYGMDHTDWTDPENRSIILGHRDHSDYTYFGDPSPQEWIGNISVPEYLTLSDGVSIEGMYADFNFYDENLSRKIAYGGVRCGVSAGMDFDYMNKRIKRFNRQSIVKNPACKKAFLNLSDEESGMDTMEPTFLTLSNDQSIERGTNINQKMKDEEKIKSLEDKNAELEAKVAELEKVKETVPEPVKEPEVKVEPKNEPKTPEPKVVTPEPVKPEPTKPEPVVIEKEVIKEVSNNGDVVDAINKMSDKFADEIKKVADPATTAATNPNTIMNSSEDETTKQDLVDMYLDLHPEKRE